MKRRRLFTSDNVVLLIAVLVAILVGIVQLRLRMPQRWHAADTWTLVPFFLVITVFRRYWLGWRFWAAWLICLGFHLLLMWEIFGRLLVNVQWIGTIYVVPFEIVEFGVLVIIVGKIMRKLGEPGKYIRLT
jgi:hypothetical protein